MTCCRSSRHKVPGSVGEAPASRVIVLGAGMVSAPLVEYLHRGKNLNITVGESQFRVNGSYSLNIWSRSHATLLHT